jgi:hypothetical protein
VVHDWDSVAVRSEAVIAGVAAAIFCATGTPGGAASVDETAAFLRAYEQGRERCWSADEREACWAARLWSRAFDARKAAEIDVKRSLKPCGVRRPSGFAAPAPSVDIEQDRLSRAFTRAKFQRRDRCMFLRPHRGR